jgi:hypothetical protein
MRPRCRDWSGRGLRASGRGIAWSYPGSYKWTSRNSSSTRLGEYAPYTSSIGTGVLHRVDHDDAPEDLIDLRRTALTPEQIRRMGIEPDLKPPSGDHAKEFIARGLEPAAQLEAIPHDALSALVRQAVESTLDLDILRASREQEQAQRSEVQQKLDEVNEVLREAFGLGSPPHRPTPMP